MSDRTRLPPESPPFADLLAALGERGLPIGMREHLAVARLAGRWEETDVRSLRSALAAVLSRSVEDAGIVHETFDRLYAPDEEDFAFLERAARDERGVAAEQQVARHLPRFERAAAEAREPHAQAFASRSS